MIEVEDVEKSFRTVRALRGIRFSARDGEVTGLIGPQWGRQDDGPAHHLHGAQAR